MCMLPELPGRTSCNVKSCCSVENRVSSCAVSIINPSGSEMAIWVLVRITSLLFAKEMV